MSDSERLERMAARIADLEAERSALLDRSARLDAITTHAPNYVVEVDRDGMIRWSNRPAPNDPPAEIVGTSLELLMHPEDRPAFRGALAQVFETQGVHAYESTGAVTGRRYLNRIAPITRDGEVESAILIGTDITDLKVAEAEVRTNERRWRALVEASFEGLALSVDGRLIEVNEALGQMMHCRREELIGKSPLDLTTPESARRIMERIRTGDERPYEITAVRADGTTLPVELLGRNIVWDGRPARVTGFRDLTEKRRLEAEQRRLEEQVRHTQRLETIGVLAGGIAHDVNNLLQAIIAHAELAQLFPDDAATHLDKLAAVVDDTAALTRALLTYAGRSPARPAPMAVADLVASCEDLFRVAVADRARLEVVIDETAMIYGDPALLRQVLVNLVANAAEAIHESRLGGRIAVVSAQVTVGPEGLGGGDVVALQPSPGRYVRLTVEDDGPGMDPTVAARVFEPFFTTRFQGRGLGLASVLGIVRIHNGGIRLATAAGLGARFDLYLPTTGEAAERRTPAPVQRRSEGVFRGRVLLADDDLEVRRVTTELLASLGLTVIDVDGGRAAVEAFTADPDVSAVLLDLAMPDMPGDHVAAAIRALRPDVPIALLTGYGSQAPTTLRGARIEVLSKPFGRSALATLLNRLLK